MQSMPKKTAGRPPRAVYIPEQRVIVKRKLQAKKIPEGIEPSGYFTRIPALPGMAKGPPRPKAGRGDNPCKVPCGSTEHSARSWERRVPREA